MRKQGRIAALVKAPEWMWLAALVSVVLCGLASDVEIDARPQISFHAVTDQIEYNVGSAVSLRIISPPSQMEQAPARYVFAVRYEGDAKPVVDGLVLGDAGSPYSLLWKVPLNARTGRYEIDVHLQDPTSQQVIQEIPGICSFVVHRQAIRLSTQVRESYYTSGAPIECSVEIQNLGSQPLSGLRLEFSERYWPWIAQQRDRVGTAIVKLQDEISVKPDGGAGINAVCAVAGSIDKPSIKQYAAVIWDHDRKNVLAIALTPLVFVNPPGVAAPRPYPLQYVYPDLAAVNTTSYRSFRAEPFGASAIHFDTQHTQFPAGDAATVKFSVSNPTDVPWRHINVQCRIVSPDGSGLGNRPRNEPVDLNPHGAALNEHVSFQLPSGESGLFRVKVDLADAAGQILASNELELGVNPLPKSVLMFCAHEDDDGTQMGFIRSLVENQIPFHLVYYTSGDAGSCDRYFQHSCGPAEALNFGAIRMQEARAAMGHLGVPPENIYFLGLPDGGTGKIWYNHLLPSDPYLAVLLASDHAPYEGLFRPNLPYSRDAVVEAAEEIIKKFQPEVVFTNHPPAEGHIDHIVNNYFTVKALQELLRASAVSPGIEVRVDGVFDPKGYPATPYHYEDHQFYVSGEAMARAQEAGWFYQSQGGNRGEGNLRIWNQLRRSEAYRKVLDWKEHEGWNEKE